MVDTNHDQLDFTGERYLPEVPGQLELEHFHRYVLASRYVAGKRVLDIASGEGYGSNLMADVALTVVGVDISAEAVAHAQTRYVKANLSYRQGDAAAIPLETASVDVVVSFETIEHHDKHAEMLAEIKRVLVPGGLLIISSPNKKNYTDIPKYDNPYHVKELYREELHALLQTTFANVQLFGQRVVYGSLIAADSAITNGFSAYVKGETLERTSDLAFPVYDIAFASDRPLPGVELTFYEQKHGDEFAAAYLTAELMKHYNHVQQLDKKINEMLATETALRATIEDMRATEKALRSMVEDMRTNETTLRSKVDRMLVMEADLRKRVTEGGSQFLNVTEVLRRREVEVMELSRQIHDWNVNAVEVHKRDNERLRVINELSAELHALRSSRTWRLFAPLRWASRQRGRVRRALALLPGAIERAGGLVPFIKVAARAWSKGGLNAVKAAANRHQQLSELHTFTAPEMAAEPNKREPEILFISHEASRTGAPIFLLDLIRIVKDSLDIRCTILLCAGGDLEGEFRQLGDVFVLPARQFVDPVTMEALRNRDIRLIYANTITNGSVQQQLKPLKKPTICHVHELAYSIERHFGFENLERVVDATDLFLAGSNVVRNYLIGRGKVPADRVVVGYPFIDIAGNRARAAALPPPLPLRKDAVVVVACGTICWRKGTDLFLQVAQRVLREGNRNVEFVWVGGPLDGADYSNLRYDAEQLGVIGNIHFPGAVADHIPYLAQGDIFLLPSREDPFPLVVLDAASLGSPIVCFEEAGGAPELVEHDAGRTVKYMDVDAMADAVGALIDDPALRKRLGDRAREKVEARHDRSVVGGQTVEIIRNHIMTVPE